MAAFPSLGKLQLSGYGEQPDSAVLRTDMEGGIAKQQKIRSRVSVQHPVAYDFTAAEYATFRTFFINTLNRGASWFDWIDPRDGTVKQARIIGGKYSASAFTEADGATLSWQVSFNLETLE